MDEEDLHTQQSGKDAKLQFAAGGDQAHADVGQRQQRRAAEQRGQQDGRRLSIGQRPDEVRHDQAD